MSNKKSKQQLQLEKENLLKEKVELEAIRKAGTGWTKDRQNRLNDVAMALVDIDEALENMPEAETGKGYEPAKGTENMPEAETGKGYEPAKGTEKLVHLMLSRGVRYSSKTGKEINPPYKQVFTYSEWQVFKDNFKSLGYTITEVLHDPYNDAEKYVEKEEQ